MHLNARLEAARLEELSEVQLLEAQLELGLPERPDYVAPELRKDLSFDTRHSIERTLGRLVQIYIDRAI